MIVYLTLAIMLMIAGHFLKVQRWSQFIEVYEVPDKENLWKALAAGHVVNAVLPFRFGDLLRMGISGKRLKNGYPFAIATVAVDLYLDILTVGVVYLGLTLCGMITGRNLLAARIYMAAALFLLICSALFLRNSHYIKKIIQKVSAVFNSRIELFFLYTSWSVISSLKDIYRKLDKSRLSLYTFSMWVMYILSYTCFARFLTKSSGEVFSVWNIFTTLFASNLIPDFWAEYMAIMGREKFGVYLMIYLLVPLVFIYLCAGIRAKRRKREYTVHRQLLPHLNANERLSFLETYFSDERKEYIKLFLRVNENIGIVKDLSAGSNATTMLCIRGKETFYRKYAIGVDAEKLLEQVEWIERYQTVIPLPEILDTDSGDGYCRYDMRYYPQGIGLFQFVHSVPVEIGWELIKRALNSLEWKLYSRERKKADGLTAERYIRDKVTKNVEAIRNGGRYLKALWHYREILINGAAYPNLREYEDMLSLPRLKEIFREDEYAEIHGDLTIENIICLQGESPSFYFIDPNTGNIHNSPFLDYAKLLQSLHGGYEFLMTVNNVEIEENRITFLYAKSSVYEELYLRLKEYLFSVFSLREVRSIYYHEIVHYLRLMPYKIRKDPKLAVLFYAALLMIMKEVREMFGGEKTREWGKNEENG